MSIRVRLLLLILFATLIPAVVGGMQFLERRDVEIADAQRDLAATAQGVAQVLRDTVRATAQLHYGLSRARDLDTQDKAACSAFLADVLKEHPQYTGILTITPKGDLFCDSLRTGRALHLTDRRYFQQALNSKNPLAVEPVFGRLTGIAVLQIAYAARRDTGEPKFVLLASLNLEKYMQLRAMSLPRKTAAIALVDGKGTILTWHPDGEKLRGTSIADSPLFRFARERHGEEVREDIEVGGVSRIWAASALPEFPEAGLHVLVGVSRNDLLAAANRNLGQALAILSIVSLLAFAGAWALVELAIRRQAARIIAAVARFSGGDFGARIGKPYPRGEIGGLMVALDQAFELTQAAHRRVAHGAEALARTNRALKVLSEGNQALVRAPDEATLLRDLCRIVVEFGGYLKCWVGYAEQDTAKSIRPVAQAGYEDGYLETLNLTWADRERGRGPMASAIRGGVPVLEKNIPADPDSAAWRERAVREGYAALIALPIKSNGHTLGALVIYAAQSDRFDDREAELLVELATDLGYGIQALRNRAELEKHRHRLEELVEQRTTQLASANRAKSTFLAVMSHEIRTPMNGLLGMLELLSLTRLDAEQRATLDVVRESGRSLQRIIGDILDFSKIEAGKLEVSPVASSVGEVLEGTRNLYSGAASSKNLLLTCSTDPHIRPALVFDPLRLQQILNNLVSNAIKFTSQGEVTIKAELVARHDDEEIVRFSVKDSGMGISPETQARLFQPFVQAEAKTAREFGGTGLGLTICERLAHLMGGSIEMASELGRGTEIALTLSLPVANPNDLALEREPAENLDAIVNNARQAPSVEEAEREGTLVLLVDDHPINRMLLCRQIDALGYAAESAENGVEALEKWKSGRFGAVITDCNMPEMDGYELARTVRRLESQQGRARIPVIACTANALSGDIEVCRAAGMDDYLPKPVQLADLMKKLRQWLPQPRAADTTSDTRTKSLDSVASGSSTPSPVDASVLNAISDGVTESARQVLLDFWCVNDEDVSALERAVAGNEHSQIARVAHRIKGASRMAGAFDLAALCERIEQASRVQDLEAVRTNMDLLHHELERLNRYISSL